MLGVPTLHQTIDFSTHCHSQAAEGDWGCDIEISEQLSMEGAGVSEVRYVDSAISTGSSGG